MHRARSVAALALCVIILTAPGFGQTPLAANPPGAPQTPPVAGGPSSPGVYTAPEVRGYSGQGMVAWFSRNYLPRPTRAISWADSPRLERLMRAGIIYLSLRDAIALALENNLDIENARFNLPQAEANLLRASAGQLLTNVSNSISSGPSSASGVLAGFGRVWSRRDGKLQRHATGRVERAERAVGGFARFPISDPAFYTQDPVLAPDHAAHQRLLGRHQRPGHLAERVGLRLPTVVPHGHHRDPLDEQHLRVLAERPQQRFQPHHQRRHGAFGQPEPVEGLPASP